MAAARPISTDGLHVVMDACACGSAAGHNDHDHEHDRASDHHVNVDHHAAANDNHINDDQYDVDDQYDSAADIEHLVHDECNVGSSGAGSGLSASRRCWTPRRSAKWRPR